MYYKTLLSVFLRKNECEAMNAQASEGQKYCNGLCQTYKPAQDVIEGRCMCKICDKKLYLAKTLIESRKITIEQFKKDPSIIHPSESPDVGITRLCRKCEKDLPLNKFEEQRNECKKCKNEADKQKRLSEAPKFIEEMERLKDDSKELLDHVRTAPFSIIKEVATHYQVGRASTDRKDQVVAKIMAHFERQRNPFMCLGGCGWKMSEEFSTCEKCKKPDKKVFIEKDNADFVDEIDDFLEDLEKITPEMEVTLNKFKLEAIALELGIKYVCRINKQGLAEIINQHLTIRENERIKAGITRVREDLTINGVVIQCREADGFVNATQMCKAGKKTFGHWYELKSTKELINALLENLVEDGAKNPKTGITIPDVRQKSGRIVVDIKMGGNDKKAQGSWIHPDLAVQLAQWVCPKFALKVSTWVRELALCGSVQLGAEKTAKELMDLQKEYKLLKNNHQKILKKRTYYEFKKGPVFYIISDHDSKSLKFKPGIDGVDINVRLAQHRSTTPGIKLEMLIYTDDCKLIEDSILHRYRNKRTYQNHEWIYDVDLKHIIDSVKTFLDFSVSDYTIESNLDEYNSHLHS